MFDIQERERERNVLFNDALNTFYLRLYGVRHMVKGHPRFHNYIYYYSTVSELLKVLPPLVDDG